MSLNIYGASDDLVEIEGHVTEEIGCFQRPVKLEIGTRETGGLRVIAVYAPKGSKYGVWRLSVEPLDEDIVVPWPVSVETKGYSCVIRIHCPDDVPVFRKGKRVGP